MNILNRVLSIIAVIVAPLGASAAVQKGLMEVNASASYSSLDVDGGDLDLGLVSGGLGYFVTNELQVTGGLTYMMADIDETDLRATLLSAAVDYHFNTQARLVPFVGARAHYVRVDVDDLDDDDWAWEVRAGLKHFVADNVAIRYSVSYLQFDKLELDGVSVGVGLSFFF